MSDYRRKLMMAYAANKRSGNIIYPGLIAAWSAKGKTNDDEDRAILKDLTGNGHDITLNGFAFSEMSGYNGYPTDFTKWDKNRGGTYNLINKNIVHITNCAIIGGSILNCQYSFLINKNTTLKISGLIDGQSISFGSDNNSSVEDIQISSNGIYKIQWNKQGIIYSPCILAGFIGDCDITIELLPEYPDALVFDGIDDYGFSDNVPFLTDYTIIVKRNWIDTTTKDDAYICAKAGTFWNKNAFTFEGNGTINQQFVKLISYGAVSTNIKQVDGLISYMTPTSYNQIKITKGSNPIDDTNYFGLAKIRPETNTFSNFAFYSAYLFDRSLDEQEIKSFIRKYIDPEYLLPSEIPTPDCYYDFSQGSNDDETRDTIKDYSGNGNDAVAHNFAWSGMSGYGGYNWNFNNFMRKNYEHTSTKAIIDTSNKPSEYSNVFENYIYNPFDGYINKGCRIKVSGITGNGYFNFYNGALSVIIQEDGEYSIEDYTTSQESQMYYGFNALQGIKNNAIVVIELLPEYPGSLIFDGVDDYVSLDAFDSGFKTVFMVCKPFVLDKIIYDQRKYNDIDGIAIYNKPGEIAYQYRNTNGITYINLSENNRIISDELINKKHIITLINSNTPINKAPYIGASYGKNNKYYANMALYKFLGFKEALTEEQIQYVIKKYNLLDGVDKIEVN